MLKFIVLLTVLLPGLIFADVVEKEAYTFTNNVTFAAAITANTVNANNLTSGTNYFIRSIYSGTSGSTVDVRQTGITFSANSGISLGNEYRTNWTDKFSSIGLWGTNIYEGTTLPDQWLTNLTCIYHTPDMLFTNVIAGVSNNGSLGYLTITNQGFWQVNFKSYSRKVKVNLIKYVVISNVVSYAQPTNYFVMTRDADFSMVDSTVIFPVNITSSYMKIALRFLLTEAPGESPSYELGNGSFGADDPTGESTGFRINIMRVGDIPPGTVINRPDFFL
jgi:hypothetical protein